MSGPKLERPLFIDMDFGEALRRYAQTDPSEVSPAPKRQGEKGAPGGRSASQIPGDEGEEASEDRGATDRIGKTSDPDHARPDRKKGGVRQSPKGSTDAG